MTIESLRDQLPATQVRIIHSTIEGGAPLFVVISLRISLFISSVPNHSTMTVSIRCEASISKTGRTSDFVTLADGIFIPSVIHVLNQALVHESINGVLTEKTDVGSRMTNEFDEWLTQGSTKFRVWSHYISHRVNWKQKADSENFHRLQHNVLSPETWESFVPNGRQ